MSYLLNAPQSLLQGSKSIFRQTLKDPLDIECIIWELETHGNGYITRFFPLIANIVRNASKKQAGSTRNTSPKTRPKHRGWKVQDGHEVTYGTILVTQRQLRFHPGLNVGLGRNGTLFAIIPGKVVVTCEQVDPDWDHTWVQRCHGHRRGTTFYKKYFNVLPEKQHQNFKLIDQV